mmetsp:Transcript_23019/g.52722  ORF Transcript_23019/g.52722 Transcript_23019/m.52722 type:complete len:356 (+) Transcript_23019:318-1385(+)
MVAHVPLVCQHDARILQQPHGPVQRAGREVGPPVGRLEEVHEAGAPEPEESARPGRIAEDQQHRHHRAEQVDVRDVGVPGDADDGGGVLVVVLEPSGQPADARQPARRVVEDEVHDAAGEVHVDIGRQAEQQADPAAQLRPGHKPGAHVPSEAPVQQPVADKDQKQRQAYDLCHQNWHLLRGVVGTAEVELVEARGVVGGIVMAAFCGTRGEHVPPLSFLVPVDTGVGKVPTPILQAALQRKGGLRSGASPWPPPAAGIAQFLPVRDAVAIGVQHADILPVPATFQNCRSKVVETALPAVHEERVVGEPYVAVVGNGLLPPAQARIIPNDTGEAGAPLPPEEAGGKHQHHDQPLQ